MAEAEPEGEPTKTPAYTGKKCGARKRSGPGCCTKPGTGAGGRCRWHGGATPTGLASPHWKTGKRSKHARWARYLPSKGLGKYFAEAYSDRALFQNRRGAATIDALVINVTARLKNGQAVSQAAERRLLNLLEHQRRMNDSEARREMQLGQMVTRAQWNNFLAVTADIMRDLIPTDRLVEAQRRFTQALLAAPNAADGEVIEGD